MRIAWFSPLPPVSSGISLYSLEILQDLVNIVDVDIYVDDRSLRRIREANDLPRIFPSKDFAGWDQRARYDVVFYNIGNSPAHIYMYQIAIQRPGVLILHDTVLHHLVIQMTIGAGKPHEYADLMRRHYGTDDDIEKLISRVQRGQTPASLFDYSLSEDIILTSKATVVHSQYNANQIRRWVPRANVVQIPMGVRLPPSLSRTHSRTALGLKDDQFVISSITHVNPYKRVDVALRALKRLRQRVPAKMIIAGSVSESVPLQRWIRYLGFSDIVDVSGFVSDNRARLIAAASDAVINLRYPTAGETSASLLRLMAAGRPVIVSDTGSFCEFPEGTVIKIPVDVLEEDMLTGALELLADDPVFGRNLGMNAQRFIEEHHELAGMVNHYLFLIEQMTGKRLARIGQPARRERGKSLDCNGAERLQHVESLSSMVGRAFSELGLPGDSIVTAPVACAMTELGLTSVQSGATNRSSESEMLRMAEHENQHQISERLLEILACPVCKTSVRLESHKLVCDTCGRRYRIENGIPVMLVDEAEQPPVS